ncbi:restriction endonuclease subunit S [Aliiroseovarius sp. Z3]|uniref:restriction endonuclease subunit S n=1 Tax=Aliiroseovarius sp. Z3 TaxID=2811402 RepID=UPI0023B22493|nr:restriction endonuclease subunit S [Aliiroseovarius sp. Z3]MDE9450433.1 restriction endonuclease subunit S [Aliiroseovarius sp. Z3]
MSELPSGWVSVTISDLGEVVSGGTPSTKVPEYWGGDIVWFSPADLTGYTRKTIRTGAKNITEKGLANSSAKLMPAGSILFSSRAPIGYVAISMSECATNQGFKSLVPSKHISSDYVFHYLKSAKQLAEKHASGTTFKEVSGRAFARLPVPLPPIDEQRRIVEKIEQLFGLLDKGEESLRVARDKAGLYRQSLLKHAFEGHLTADWRAANPDKLEAPETLLTRIQEERDTRYKQALDDWQDAMAKWRAEGEEGKKPAKPKRLAEVIGKPQIPDDLAQHCFEDWTWLPVSDVAVVTGGLTKNQKRNSHPLKMKYLRVANVYADRLELNEITEIGVTKEEFEKLKLEEGDLLVVEGNGSIEQIGRVALWNGRLDDIGHQNHLIRARFETAIVPRFALLFLMSPLGRKLIIKKANSTSGLHTLSISKVSSLALPVPCVAEQAEIVSRLEAKLSTLDALEADIDRQLARSRALRQSILKRAFEGKLVPQDPTDEPASALLERIKAERDAAPKPKRKRKTPA